MSAIASRTVSTDPSATACSSSSSVMASFYTKRAAVTTQCRESVVRGHPAAPFSRLPAPGIACRMPDMTVDAGHRQTRFAIHRLHPELPTHDTSYNGWVLFDPAAHERLTERPWDPEWARAAIAAVAADAEAAFDEDALWPAHPRDEEE